MVDWETIEVPRGSFIGWGTKAGQQVVGRVHAYDINGGTDFNGEPCPQIDIELTEPTLSYNKAGDSIPFSGGDFVTVTAGSISLKPAIRRADPAVGDLIKIVMTGMEELSGGRSKKTFQVQIARGQNKPAPARQPVSGGAAGFNQDDDAPPF